MAKTMGVRGTFSFMGWARENGWRPLPFRFCTHEAHQRRRHFYSRVKGARLYQHDWHMTGEELRAPGQKEQICEKDLVVEYNRYLRGEVA